VRLASLRRADRSPRSMSIEPFSPHPILAAKPPKSGGVNSSLSNDQPGVCRSLAKKLGFDHPRLPSDAALQLGIVKRWKKETFGRKKCGVGDPRIAFYRFHSIRRSATSTTNNPNAVINKYGHNANGSRAVRRSGFRI